MPTDQQIAAVGSICETLTICNRRRPVSQMEDDQRKAMFARMGRGGGSRPVPVQQHGASGSWDEREYDAEANILDYTPGYDGYHPEDITSTNPADLTNPRRMAARENLRLDRENEHSPVPSLLRDLLHLLPDSYSEGDLYGMLDDFMMASMAAGGPAIPIPASGIPARVVRPVIKPVSALMKFLKAALTSAASGAIAYGIGEYRESSDRIHPKIDHYLAMGQDLSSMISALAFMKSTTRAVGPLLKASHKGLLNIDSYSKTADLLAKGLEAIKTTFPRWLGNQTPTLSKLLKPLGKAYSFVSDFTGAEAPGVLEMFKSGRKFATAKYLLAEADKAAYGSFALKSQAGLVSDKTLFNLNYFVQGRSPFIHGEMLKAERALAATKLANLQFGGTQAMRAWAIQKSTAAKMLDPNITATEKAGAQYLWAKAHNITQQNKANTARDLLRRSHNLTAEGIALKRQAVGDIVKGLTSIGAVAGVDAYEQSKIKKYKQELKESYDLGESYFLPADMDYAYNPISELGFMAMGTLGNPLEKQTRNYASGKYSLDLIKRANQEVQFENIQHLEATGQLSREEADAAFKSLHENQPWNMKGAAIYTIQPAIAGFLKYAGSKFAESALTPKDIGQVVKVIDGDTIDFRMADGEIRRIRMSGVDTPETVKADTPVQYMGPEASAYSKHEIEVDDWIRLARDSKNLQKTTDKYGRELGYVETLPDGLDNLFKIPVINQIVGARDFNKSLIEKGLGQPKYAHLNEHTPERDREYDLAVQAAKAKKIGIWSDEGMEKLDFHYTPKYPAPTSQLSMPLGMGLMVSGNSGVFRGLGDDVGGMVAQLWNAAAAVAGSYEHSVTGMKNQGKTFNVPKLWPESADDQYVREFLESRGWE